MLYTLRLPCEERENVEKKNVAGSYWSFIVFSSKGETSKGNFHTVDCVYTKECVREESGTWQA